MCPGVANILFSYGIQTPLHNLVQYQMLTCQYRYIWHNIPFNILVKAFFLIFLATFDTFSERVILINLLSSRENQYQVFACFFEETYYFRTPHQISVPALISQFFQCTFIAGFRNNFQGHRRRSECSLKRVIERNFTISRDFLEASRNIILDFLYKKTTENCENHKRSFKSTVSIFKTFKKYSSRDTIT